ncbi:MAG: hypothetical protein H0T56_17545 [Pseudaminobacter sp.]|nr:hypothetical protein [Pseudaminobacter sp.]
MKELLRSIMAEMKPFWLKHPRGTHSEEGERVDEIIRANPYEPSKYESAWHQRKIPQRPATIGKLNRTPGANKP